MANSFGLLLFAIVIITVVARLMKDAKAFGKLLATFTISFLVGAVLSHAVNTTSKTEKATVVSTISVPTGNSSSPVVLEDTTTAIPGCPSKEINTERDIVETQVGEPTSVLNNSEYIDDS